MYFFVTPTAPFDGYLYFSVPTENSRKQMEDEIFHICFENLPQMYGDIEGAKELLEQELSLMRKTKTALHFMVLKEVAILSEKEDFPLVLFGGASGAMISYLLGITPIRPLPQEMNCFDGETGYSFIPELIWGDFETPTKPDFSIQIASSLHSKIQSALDKAFGYLDSEKDLYHQISLARGFPCEELGFLRKRTKEKGRKLLFQEDVFREATKFFRTKKDPKEKELNWDFQTFVKFCGYNWGSFLRWKNKDDILAADFYPLRDDLFLALKNCRFTTEEALFLSKQGLWRKSEKKEQYLKQLAEHNAPEHLIQFFRETTHLWPSYGCTGRIMAYLEYAHFEVFYPELIEEMERNNL